MALFINTNVASLNLQSAPTKTNASLSNAFARASASFRTSSQDNAAGLAISRQMNADIAARMSTRSSAVTLSQSLEGGLSSTQDVLTRMQDLARQSLDSATSAADRDTLNAEFTQLKQEVTNISQNGQSWFVMGSGAPKSTTVGDASLDQSRVALVGKSDQEDGILTRSYDGVSMSSDAFNISGASTKEQREGVLKALEGMSSGVRTAQYAVSAFQGGATAPVANGPASLDDGTYKRPVFDASDVKSERINTPHVSGASVLSAANSLPRLASMMLRG